jgi:acetyl esterase/lipase
MPPTFITQAEDDHAFVPGTKIYFAALQAAGVPSKMVLFANGGHGFGLRSQKDAKVWPIRCQEWLHQIGIL